MQNNIDMDISLNTKEQIDLELEGFINQIQKAAWNSTKITKHKTLLQIIIPGVY